MRNRFRKKRICIFMDNLAVHHCLKVKNYIKSHDMYAVFNAPYFPDGNPIESVFSKVKHLYKCEVTNH